MRKRRVSLTRLLFSAALLASAWLVPGLASAGEAPTLTLAPLLDFNPQGTTHTLTAQINPATSGAKVFFQVGGICLGGDNDGTACFPGGSECTGGGACTGPDLGDEFDCTTQCNDAVDCDPPATGDGSCEGSYTNTAGPGVNNIRACALTVANLDSIATYDDCVNEGNDPILTETSAVKVWLAKFVTGGWTRGKGKTLLHTGAGTFGEDPLGSGNFIGQYNIVDHVNNVSCHFNTFRNLIFDCNNSNDPCTGSPPSADNVATVWMSGTCNKECGAIEGTLEVEDNAEPGKGADKVSWTRDSGTCLPSFCSPAPGSSCLISGGNIQVHSPPPPAE